MNYDLKQSLRASLGLEDNSQVEVNFHIDTDEDNAPVVAETPELAVDDNTNVEAEEAAGDTDNASDEMSQLQEAQDSLESLNTVLDTQIKNGTVSDMSLTMYRLALESIVPRSVMDEVGLVSMENSKAVSIQHASYLAKVELEEVTHQVGVVSLEAKMDFLKKATHAIDTMIRQEGALLKRATALRALAQGSENEHASNDRLTVNGGSKSPNMRHITTLSWNSEGEFVKHVKHFTDLFNSMSSLKPGYDDDFTDRIFPDSRDWTKDKDGNPSYETFRIKLVRKKKLVRGYMQQKVVAKRSLPNLTPRTCEEVLNIVISTLTHGKVMKANLKEMTRILSTVVKREYKTSVSSNPGGNGGIGIGLDVTETYPPGYIEMYQTLVELRKVRIKVNSDILSYVNYCLTDREFV